MWLQTHSLFGAQKVQVRYTQPYTTQDETSNLLFH